jgi:hypothetical protein
MKGHVSRRGKSWAYWFDIDPDPLTGKRRQQTKSGFRSEKDAWKACREAMADYDKGRLVRASRRTVADALTQWLTRIEHSLKPSMAQNWRNYASYYVIPYIGARPLQDIDGAVCDALYAMLLAEGRVKPSPSPAVTATRFTPGVFRQPVASCSAAPTATTRCGVTASTPKTTRFWARRSLRSHSGQRPTASLGRRPAWSPRRS